MATRTTSRTQRQLGHGGRFAKLLRVDSTPPRSFRRWFYAAAVYNAAWGVAASLAPTFLLRLAGYEGRGLAVLMQTVGMIVGVYAYGYWLIARDPVRYANLVWIGLLGKVLGPLGFLLSAARGEIGWAFGLTILLNDVFWWPAMGLFAYRYARTPFPPESGE